MNLEVSIGGIKLRNPLILASGTFGFGEKFPQVLKKAGGIVTKGVTRNAREGNPLPRIWDDKCYVLNSIGLENPGVDRFLKEILPRLNTSYTFFIVNVAGFCVDDYFYIIDKLKDTEIDGFELNVSCPNIKREYRLIGASHRMVRKIVRGVRSITDKPIFVKLTPNYCDPVEIAMICDEEKADAVVVFNTLFGMAIDIKTRKPRLGGIRGGISGPGIKPFVVYSVYEIARRVSCAVIASGGVNKAEDVVEYMLAGARAVEIGSMNLKDPYFLLKILKDLKKLLKDLKISKIESIIGKLEV